jgi:hypothetical protein
MARTVAGLFADRASAEQAMAVLRAEGFDSTRMGLVAREQPPPITPEPRRAISSTAGAIGGSLILGTLAALLAWGAGAAIPGLAGNYTYAVVGVSLVGGMIGWLVGGLLFAGRPIEEAEYIRERVEQGSVLLTLDARGREDDALRVLQLNGARAVQRLGARRGFAQTPRRPDAEPIEREGEPAP